MVSYIQEVLDLGRGKDNAILTKFLYYIVFQYVKGYVREISYYIQTRLDVIWNDPDALLVLKDIMTTYFEVEYESLSVLFSSFHLWDGEDPA